MCRVISSMNSNVATLLPLSARFPGNESMLLFYATRRTAEAVLVVFSVINMFLYMSLYAFDLLYKVMLTRPQETRPRLSTV